MIEVKKLNLTNHIKNINHVEYTSFEPMGEVGLIEGSDKYIIVNSEGVHELLYNCQPCSIELFGRGINKETGLRFTTLTPVMIIKLSLKEIKSCTEETIPAYQFVRRFGRRLEENFSILMNSCKEINIISTSNDMELRKNLSVKK